MKNKIKLQNRLLVSIGLIVFAALLSTAWLLSSIEEKNLERSELKRICLKSAALSRGMGHLMYSSNWRYMMLVLAGNMKNDTSMLYFFITDSGGKILLCDDKTRIGSIEPLRVPLVQPGEEPVFNDMVDSETGDNTIKFNVYRTRLEEDIRFNGLVRGDRGEEVFDTFWDIRYMGESLGSLRMGFSRKDLVASLHQLQVSVLGVDALLLVVLLTMIFVVVKKSMAPLEAFTRAITAVHGNSGGNDLKEQLEKISLDQIPGSTLEMEKLLLAFGNLRNLVVLTWEELEQQRDNIESMVLDRTHELEAVNKELEHRILERKQIEERLMNAQKLEAVGTLAGGVAHDFNNLLMAIQGNAGLIQQRTKPGDPSNDKAKKIVDLVDTGAEVVQQLLGFARGGKYAPSPLSVNLALDVNLNMFNRTRKDLTIQCSYQQDVWPVKADKSQLDQVILNLFLNASEAMEAGGFLSIETQNIVLDDEDAGLHGLKPGRFVRFSVTDSGDGMDEEIRTRVFDPFFTTKQMGRGTGLGLASVHGIVKNHGGFVTVQSLHGRGATFSVVLPAINIEVNS